MLLLLFGLCLLSVYCYLLALGICCCLLTSVLWFNVCLVCLFSLLACLLVIYCMVLRLGDLVVLDFLYNIALPDVCLFEFGCGIIGLFCFVVGCL